MANPDPLILALIGVGCPSLDGNLCICCVSRWADTGIRKLPTNGMNPLWCHVFLIIALLTESGTNEL